MGPIFQPSETANGMDRGLRVTNFEKRRSSIKMPEKWSRICLGVSTGMRWR